MSKRKQDDLPEPAKKQPKQGESQEDKEDDSASEATEPEEEDNEKPDLDHHRIWERFVDWLEHEAGKPATEEEQCWVYLGNASGTEIHLIKERHKAHLVHTVIELKGVSDEENEIIDILESMQHDGLRLDDIKWRSDDQHRKMLRWLADSWIPDVIDRVAKVHS